MCSKRYTPFKLAPPIHQALVIAEKQIDQKVWFTVRVIPQQTDIRYVNGVPVGIKAVARQPYSIARRYEDFVQLSQRLHEAFPPLTTSHNTRSTRHQGGPSIPKLSNHSSSKRIHLLHNQAKRQLQRRTDLEKFLYQLFRLPASIAQSLPVLEFFGQQSHDRRTSKVQLCSVMTDPMPTLMDSSPSTWQRLCARATSSHHQQMSSSQSCTTMSTFGKKKRKPSTGASSAAAFPYLSPSPSMMTTTTPSSSPPSAASSPCPQSSLSTATTISSIASMIMPSFSTPRRIGSSSTISRSSTTSSRDSVSTCDSNNSSTSTTPPGSPISTSSCVSCTIKIKVIYDVDNIIVIQVPRTVSMADLRSRIMLKFSLDPATRLPTSEFCLLYNDARSSGTSAASCFSARSDRMTIIADDKDLRAAMDKLWSQHEKVTLRCIAKNNPTTRRRPSLL
ncbi:hypothetical protein K492DRAFT_173419 [Lichtheimia hyalospora FSU 10163]|nr:hypothetical protein K492DRAFT_173419 [Lichtheimia hyalospora FSU 10163]